MKDRTHVIIKRTKNQSTLVKGTLSQLNVYFERSLPEGSAPKSVKVLVRDLNQYNDGEFREKM